MFTEKNSDVFNTYFTPLYAAILEIQTTSDDKFNYIPNWNLNQSLK